MKGLFGNGKVIAALVVPGIAVMVFSLVVPIGFSAYYSLTDWAGFGKFHMIGLANYRDIITADPVFWRALMNALILMVVTICIQNPAAFALAAVLSHLSPRFSRVLRTVYFVPAVLSLVVITKLWVSIFN
ncbi:MAG: carbohydrate ABC transporter permease, partial [Spirochaetia bacterium]